MDPSPIPGSARSRRLLVALLAFAFLLRLAHWWAVRNEPFFAQLVMDSQEYDRWARGIAAGDWLGSEVFFQAPLYPYLLGFLYILFGPHLAAVYLFQIALSVAGIYALYRAGREMVGEGVGLAAAGLAAIYGPFLFYDVQILKESPAVAVTGFLLWALAAARARPSFGRWLGAGVLSGILALLRENALLIAPLLALLAWRRPLRPLLRDGGAFLLGTVLALTPVALRNDWVGGEALPTTSQGGVNFYIGNNAQADGTYRPIVPGKQIPALERREPARVAEQALGRHLSAGEVSRYWLGRALAWARANPGDFLRLQLQKLRLFWSWYEQPDAVDYYYAKALSPILRLPLLEFGGAALLAAVGALLARKRLGPFAPALVFLLGWTVSTVAFFLFSRYRLPAVPALLLLGGVPVAEGVAAFRAGERKRAYGLAAVVLVALFLPRLAGFTPRLDLVHYNLARLAEDRGQPEEAAAHYRAALESNPEDFLSYLNLGNLAARQGDLPTALRLYERAAALEPRSDDAQSNLGGAWLALGRLPEAREHLDRALALNPQNLKALHNRALLALKQGDLPAARTWNARELAVDPKNPVALRLKERLEPSTGATQGETLSRPSSHRLNES
ncbi:MAG TPA: tetratricopeptide repeat protein, partial [Thermoanaerobaculia bacterium]|nr:tetratricopeptide repeat protein [Thermoanaerobaculia bacterium]